MSSRYYKRYLYKLTFPNGMVYIGCTYDIKTRWAGSGAHYKGMGKVYDAIQEFGWDSIKRKVIAKLPESHESTEAIKSLEKEFIKAYAGKCYNSMSNPDWHEENPPYPKERYELKAYWTIFGEKKPVRDWCKEYNTCSSTVQNRVDKYGLTYEQAITFPAVPSVLRGKKNGCVDYWKSIGLLA